MIAAPATRITIPGMNYAGKGVGVPLGCDSYSHPLFVNELNLRWLENAVTQGGFVQTRPGYKQEYSFNVSDAGTLASLWWADQQNPVVHPQMMVEFTPSNNQKQLVFAVSGTVFYSVFNPDGSLQPAVRIPSFQFNPIADQLVGCRCTQSATILGGTLANNIEPRNLLIIQDGVSRAGIWDGLVGVQANPAKRIQITSDGSTLYPEAWNQTRIGLWMAWSGNRLWLSNGQNVYASDLSDPTHFTEELRLNSVPMFTFPREVTGMCDRGTSGTNRSQVVVFTATTTWTLWSGIQSRFPSTNPAAQGWAYTADFMTKIFGEVGCTAGKSITLHRGLLYWKCDDGIVMFDGSSTVNSSQNLPPIDSEMAYSKMLISPSAEGADLTCGGKFNNYVWWSVPVGKVISGRRYNGQTQVLDRQTTTVRSTGTGGAFSAGTTGWQGVWTGIRPVEWANATVGGKERIYALSMDAVGAIHIWQAFQANRADNGQRIPWLMETRVHPVQPSIFEYATFRHFRLMLDQIGGKLDIVGMWRGLKGTYHELLTTTVNATIGSHVAGSGPTSTFESLGLQGRVVISRNQLPNVTCTSQGVESPKSDSTDRAFSLALQFVGRGAVSSYLIAADTVPDNSEGTGNSPTGIDESGFNRVPTNACPSHEAGTTPDYVAEEQPIQLGSCPFVPVQTLGFDYSSPTL
jgi:hypothetical protein